MKYIHMITITFLLLFSSMSPLWVHAETVDNDLRALNQEFEKLFYLGEYGRASMIAMKALEVAEKSVGPDHPDTATSLSNMAMLYKSQEQYTQAESLYKRALVIREKSLKADHLDIATSLNNLASLYQTQGEYAQAEPLFKRALAVREKSLKADHFDIATSLNNLASLYLTQGEYAQAEPLFKRALAISEKSLNQAGISVTLGNLAGLYQEQGQYAQAEPLFKRSLAIFEKDLGPEHQIVATGLNNLAALYQVQGQYTQAETLYKRALTIREKTLGKDHSDVAVSLGNLASLYQTRGKYAQAEPLFKRTLAISEKMLDPGHPSIARNLNNLAMLYKDQGKFAQAEPLLKRALAMNEKALGEDHPAVATMLNNLATLYSVQSKYKLAEPLLKRSLMIREKILGSDHPSVATSLNNLAMLYEDQGLYIQAEPLYMRALSISEKALGSEHPDVAMSLDNLANLYKTQGKNVQAENLFLRSKNIRNIHDKNNTRLTYAEYTLKNTFSERCGKEAEKVGILGFPDIYLNPSELAACEVAFMNDPDKYAKRYHTRLMAKSIDEAKVFDSDQLDAATVILNHYKEEHKKEPTNIDLALAGYPEYFYNILINKSPLSTKKIIAMNQLIGESMTEILFGRYLDPKYEPSEDDLIVAVKQTLINAQHMSGAVLGIVTQNIRSALARNYKNHTVPEMYLSMPLNLRRSLLALASISNGFTHEELTAMQAIQFSLLEIAMEYVTGKQEDFISRIFEYPETAFVWLSLNIVEVQEGGFLPIPLPSVILLDAFDSIVKLHPEFIQKYSSYFPDIDYKMILDIDLDSLQKRYLDAIQNHSLSGLTEFEISLLTADIRIVAITNHSNKNFDYLNKISPDNEIIRDLISREVNPLIEFAFKSFMKKANKEWQYLSNGIEELFERIADNVDNVCDAYSEEMCDRMWRNSSLLFMNSYDKNIHTSHCQDAPQLAPILQRQLRAGHIDPKLARSCSTESLKSLMGIHNTEEMIFLLTQASGSGQLSRYMLLNNLSFILDGGGLVAKHIYKADQDKRAMLLLHSKLSWLHSIDNKAWSYFREIAMNPIPDDKRTDSFSTDEAHDSLAYIFSMMGNYERAFLTQSKVVDAIRKDMKIAGFDDKPTIGFLMGLSSLKQYSRNTGMPEPYTNLFVGKYRNIVIPALDIPYIDYISNQLEIDKRKPAMLNVNPDALRELFSLMKEKNFDFSSVEEFLGNGDLPSLLSMLENLESDELSPRMLGKMLALNHADQDEVCRYINLRKLTSATAGHPIYPSLRKFEDARLFPLSELILEYIKLDSRCTTLWLVDRNKHQIDELESEFSDYIETHFLDYVRRNIVFSDPRIIGVTTLLSEYSKVTSNTTGLVVSLITLKHSFELMADAYIYRNSATLRLKMPDIETIIVNTTKALRDAKNDGKKQTAVQSRLMRRTESLAASAHAIFVSDRTRARMLDVENKIFTEVADDASTRSNTTAYNKMTEYFHKARNSLAASKTVSEAIVNKARFGEHGIQAMPRFYKAAAQIEKAIASPKEVFPTSNNSVLLNILSNGKQIFFQLLDDKGRYLSDTLDIQASLASRLKERITRNTRITADDIKLGCEAFASVHQVLKPLIKDYSRLVVVPSVNLLPIPTELIIGTACDSSDTTIIHTADVLGAIELIRSDKDIGLPQSFVGIGNPSLPLDSDQMKIAAVDGGDKEIVRNLSAIDEFKPLPDAEEEILEIAEIFRDKSIFTAAEGSIKNGLAAAQNNQQKGKNSAIVLATHGVGLDLGQGFELPSLLSVENGQPTLIGATSVQQFDLDGSIVVLSACDTAAGLYEKPEMMFTGFVESFADAQSSFIVASLLPVRSQASKQHTVAFFRALKKGDIWQAVRAGKKAVSNATDSLPFVSIYP